MINKDCPLILSNLFEYDFSACNYRILKNIGWDLSKINFEDKEQRNIQIGYLQRDNPELSAFLRNSVNGLIDHYIFENNINEDEIILRQFDGITLSKRMSKLNTSMPIDLRRIISKMIISHDRKKWLTIDENVVVKGVSNLPIDTSFYNYFKHLDYGNRNTLSNQLESLRKKIFHSPKLDWYMFKENEDDLYSIPIKNEGFIIFRSSTLSIVKTEDLDHNFLWNEYIWPFIEPILVQLF